MTKLERMRDGYSRVFGCGDLAYAKEKALEIKATGRKTTIVKMQRTNGSGAKRRTSITYEVWATD